METDPGALELVKKLQAATANYLFLEYGEGDAKGR